MDDELTNLLPLDRLKSLRNRYFTRLLVVVMILVTLLIVASAVLLVPTYVLLSSSAATKQAYLTSLQTESPAVNESELSARLASLTGNAKLLGKLSDTPSVSQLLSTILTVSRPGTTLSGFVYTPAKPPAAATLAVTGLAATRDALRTYQLALQALPAVSAAALPVSAYAQSADIPFTIVLTLKP